MECRSQRFDQLLQQWRSGQSNARSAVLALAYDELHQLAHSYMRRQKPGHTLQTTALISEAYLRLAAQEQTSWNDRGHFLSAAARVMRCILVDHARRHSSSKRRSDGRRVSFNEMLAGPVEKPAELVALDAALEELAKLEPKLSHVVELRYFGGLGWDDIARVLGVSSSTVNRNWAVARAWLRCELAAQA